MKSARRATDDHEGLVLLNPPEGQHPVSDLGEVLNVLGVEGAAWYYLNFRTQLANAGRWVYLGEANTHESHCHISVVPSIKRIEQGSLLHITTRFDRREILNAS